MVLFWLVGAPPILEPILVGVRDVHWGYDLDFEPWPNGYLHSHVALAKPTGSLQGETHLPGTLPLC